MRIRRQGPGRTTTKPPTRLIELRKLYEIDIDKTYFPIEKARWSALGSYYVSNAVERYSNNIRKAIGLPAFIMSIANSRDVKMTGM